MKRNHLSLLCLVLFSLLLSVGFAADPDYRDGYLLVRFTEQGTTSSAQSAREAVVQAAGGGTIEKTYTIVPGLCLIALPGGTDVPTAQAAFSATLGVQYAEPDYIQNVQAIPNDTDFSKLWGMNNTGQTSGTADADIDAPEAWDLATGSRDIIVAVIDTGVDYTHPDLVANMWTNDAELNGTPGVDDDNNGYVDDIYGYDFANGDGDPMDDHSHGTHCSGTIGGVGDNGEGVAGVCWNVRIMAIKFLGLFGGTTADAISSVQYATEMNATLTSNSWGGGGFSQALYDAIAASGQTGQLFVAAAGNASTDNDSLPFYPSNYDLDNVISVMSTDDTDNRSGFSNWGQISVDLAAPGSSIYSTIPAGGYDYKSGTSMAGPHVAGACALVLSVNPDLSYTEVKDILLSTADPLGSLADMCVSEGRLNLYRAVLAVQGGGLFPDPMEWEVEPVAVGETTIFMKAVTASHVSGVQYYIDCETNPNNFDPNDGQDWYGDRQFDSGNPSDPNGWVSDTVHYRGDYETGVEYYFRVRARSIDEGLETEWSEIVGPVVPAAGLPPYPNPAEWKGTPRKISNGRIAMEAVEGYGHAVLENGQWVSTPRHYYFDCLDTNDPLFSDPNALDSWDLSARHDPNDPFYQRLDVSRISPTPPGYYYKFNLWAEGENGVPTTVDPNNLRTAYMAPPPITREVPTPSYPTIQSAIDASYHGDTVLVHPGVYREINLTFHGKAITVRSENPEDLTVVAATVIDCEDIWDTPSSFHEVRRAFMFEHGEGPDSVLAGITIKNATAIDNAEVVLSHNVWFGDPDQGNRYWGAEWLDGQDATGGAIYMGGIPASPTIRNCVFENCSANGKFGRHGNNGRKIPGFVRIPHADRGGNGGNAYGGAIYAVAGSAPLIKECQFIDCRAVGGDAGDAGNGGTGYRINDPNSGFGVGGLGGDAGLGGCAWGGAIYFESNCSPKLYDVTVDDCYVQVGEASQGGNGGDGGSNTKKGGDGGHGGNGGFGGDLRAPNSCAGGIYYGDNARVTIDGCTFENCRVVAELSGDYSAGDGGDGGTAGQGGNGGFGGHGGPAYFVPDKMFEFGGVTATGGTGGVGAIDGNGGFRFGLPGGPRAADFSLIKQQTGIWPSNMYYMSYYWEDTANIDNPTTDPNDHFWSSWDWEWSSLKDIKNNLIITTPPIPEGDDPDTQPAVPGAADSSAIGIRIFDSAFSPYYGFIEIVYNISGIVVNQTDPDPNEPFEYDFSNMYFTSTHTGGVTPLTPPTGPPNANTGACAGANYYGENSIISMKDTMVSGNNSFANHGGGELYDKGCDAQFENCIFKDNHTLYDGGSNGAGTDYQFEGFGGAIFADQPVRFVFNECEFIENSAYSGAGIYCNFAPSDPNNLLNPADPNYVAPPNLDLTECTFVGNQANYHFIYSYGGGAYAGNSLDPYEEYYFNDFTNTDNFETSLYSDHGYITFYHIIQTDFWSDILEADRILDPFGSQSPVYSVPVTECTFEENLAPYGAGLCLDASIVDIMQSQFTNNIGEVGVGGFVFASDMRVKDNQFHGNIGTDIESLGFLSEQDNSTVETLCNGGGLYVADSNLDMINNRFTGNVVDGFGGALFVNGPSLDWSPQNVINNLFVENTAGLQGGAMVASGVSDVFVQNCNFVDNSVADSSFGVGGAILAHDAFVDVKNSVFWSHEDFYPGAAMGPQISVGDPYEEVQEYDPNYIPYSTVFVEYSDVQGGENDIFVADGEGPWLWYGSDNIEDDPATEEIDEADPLFAAMSEPSDVTERTFYLSELAAGQLVDSPCLNAGIGAADDLAALLGFGVTTRTDHELDAGTVNMGYHYESDLVGVRTYMLEAEVYVADRFPHGRLVVTTEPNGLIGNAPDFDVDSYARYRFKQGTVVELLAIPDENYRVARWVGADSDLDYYEQTNTITMTNFEDVQVEFELDVPRNLYVPGSYDTIEDAIVASHSGDTIILDIQPTEPYLITDPDGINFGGKQLVITSLDPNDPSIVAGTIIDVQGSRYLSKRAFHFENGEDPNSIIQGITIRNAFTAVIGDSAAIDTFRWPWWEGAEPSPWSESPPDPLPPFRALSGADGTGNSYGGAILFENGSSPMIRNCVFENCTVAGGIGGDGADGAYSPGMQNITVDLDSQSGGHSGKGSGDGYGGAIAVLTGSNPIILNCEFYNNRATGGWGGIPGNAGTSYNGGRYGWGGNDSAGLNFASFFFGINPEAGFGEGDGHGGAIYVGDNCDPAISQCTFEGNFVRSGFVYPGGDESPSGEEYPEPYDADPWGIPGMRQGRDGFATTFGVLSGGAVFFGEDANSMLDGCAFINNTASIGGAVYADPNVILTIQDCEFSDHIGGAVYMDIEPDLEVVRSRFLNNGANQVGGALTIGVDAIDAVSIIDCDFIGNSTDDSGGAILTYSDLMVENSEFTANMAASDGGALYAYYHIPDPNTHTLELNFRNCEFNGNEAQGLGGAGFAKNCILTMEDCRLFYNKAASGGALRMPLGDLAMQRCMVVGNEATGTDNGGEGYGGGVHVIDGSFMITDSRFEVNNASGPNSAGGGLCVTGGQIYQARNLRNCLFGKNSSRSTGGGIACLQYVDLEMDNCTIADNVSSRQQGGGIYLDYASSVSLRNSIVSGNYGFGIYEKRSNCQSNAAYTLFNGNFKVLAGGSTASADLFDAQTNQAISGSGDLEEIAGYTSIFDDDPDYPDHEESGSWGAYYLTQLSSPAVDAGSMTAVDAELDMLTTDPNDMLDQGIVDLGYHYNLPVGEPEFTFTLTASVLNDRQGTVTPVSGTYLPLAVVQLTAIPEPNYRVAYWRETDNDSSYQLLNAVLMHENRTVEVEFEGAGPKNLYVPEIYNTIDEAVEAARSGDTIILAPRTTEAYLIAGSDGINFGGKQIHFTSIDPNDPLVVASTVINCQGSRYRSKRAFHFNSGEDSNTVIEGVTIRNAFTAVIGPSAVIDTGYWPWHDGTIFGIPPEPWDEFAPTPDPLPPLRALSGMDATGDSYGGAILCEEGSSPTIQKCVFESCTVAGGIGGDGGKGNYPKGMRDVTDDLDSQSGGHSGKGVGNGYGGAIAVLSGSHPKILNCEFKDNRATGGWGGIPGNAGLAYNDGRYGWGGNDWAGLIHAATYAQAIVAEWEAFGIFGFDEALFQVNDWPNAGNGYGDGRGGAVYVDIGCKPTIFECIFEGNYARSGYVSPGGNESPNGSDYPEPFDPAKPPVSWGKKDARDGRDGILNNAGLVTNDIIIAGGAVFFAEDANSMLDTCGFNENSAYEVFTYNDPPNYTRGGAVHLEPNAIVEIVDCNFIENLAGAVYGSTNSALIVDNCDFTNNSPIDIEEEVSSLFDFLDADFLFLGILDEEVVVRDVAGAITIAVDAAAPAQIRNSRFTGNTTDASGGAILAYSDIVVEDSSFNANTADNEGGAFYSYYHISDPNTHTLKLDFYNCEFSGNESLGRGGAGYTKTSVLNMTDCFFVQNKGSSGGAIYTVLSDFLMQRSLVYGNEATGTNAGAHRTAQDEGFGGGLFAMDCEVMIVDTRILNNRAQSVNACGGGVCLSGGQTYKAVSLLNCLIADNESSNSGGGLSCVTNVSAKLDSCTIADNTSANLQGGGGIFVDHLSSVSLRNSIVSDNAGYGIYEKRPGDGAFSGGESDAAYTLFYGNSAFDLFDAQTDPTIADPNVTGADDLMSIAGYTNILDSDPVYATGPLNGYYLNQGSSPAVDAGSDFPKSVGIYDKLRIIRYTTDPTDPLGGAIVIEDGDEDGLSDLVDLGYHYNIPDPNTDRYDLTAQVQYGVGTVGLWDEETEEIIPQLDEPYYRGSIVDLTADIADEYFLTGWIGGTINDNSQETDNVVLMTRGKNIWAKVRLRRTLNVGTSAEYDTLGDALDDAQDGDIVFVAPGQYTAASQFPSPLNNIELDGKKVTISGANPDDESVVRATVFNNFDFTLGNLDENTIIEGITLEQSQMSLVDASPIIRNCVFTDCQFFTIDYRHLSPVPAGADGYHQYAIFGGALEMYNSSPKIINCVFENNSVTGADGEDGFAGAVSHPDGGDGGWPSKVYGGAVYCGLSSNPEFIACTFTGNEVFGANGGKGADFITIGIESFLSGRGGGWLYDDVGEQYLIDAGWNGWAFESYGDKYTSYSAYAPFYGDYDFDVWAEWFNWSDDYSDWDDFNANYSDDSDPYDQLMDPWRYGGYGGAVYCELDSNAKFVDCVFENNQSHSGLTGVGGVQPFNAPEWPDRQLNMPTAGGAVFVAIDSDVEFTRCTFRNNVADISVVELPHTFQNSFGGAVAYEFGCEVTFTDCDIEKNTATVGGGLYGFDSVAHIVDCNVFDNEAYLGAGIFLDDEAAVISGSLVHANHAKAPGPITVPPENPEDPPVVVPSPLALTGEGGGVYAHVQHLQIRDSSFINNHSEISGGGLLLSGTVTEFASVFNCLFAENTAGRDGAGASVNWTSRVRFGNCTFADNTALGLFAEVETGEFEFVLDPETGEPMEDGEGNPIVVPVVELVQTTPSAGGGLYLSYDSIAEVIDSIFWLNLGDQGESIYVGTNAEYQRPSKLTISYSDVANWPSANAIFVEDGCTLNEGPGIFNANPDFVTLPDAEIGDVTLRYYLTQQSSSCLDAGSDFASNVGLPGRTMSEYTTSIFGALDKGLVDVGFHYRQAAMEFCRLADLVLSGRIDLADWAGFASAWLLDSCGEGNNWCNGADLNFDTEVNAEDLTNFAVCWLTSDEDAPFPDPAQWEVEPTAPVDTYDTVEMTAVLHHDLWFPDDALEYYFDCITPPDGPDSGWVSNREFTISGLAPATYRYVVRVQDPLGNVTEDSISAVVTPGENTEIPQGQWQEPPFVTDGQFAIQMEALADDPGVSGYVFRYQFDYTGDAPGGDSRPYELDPIYVDVDMVEGQTYSYRTRIGLFYEPGDGSSLKIKDGDWSAEASVVAVPPDLEPPLPNPAQHAPGSPSQLYVASDGGYYHIVMAVVATDASDVEYKFINVDEGRFSSGNGSGGLGDQDFSEGHPDQGWRNADNVAGLLYPGSETAQTPEQYWSKRGISTAVNERWYILVRDRSPSKNETAPSEYRTIQDPEPQAQPAP